MVKIVVASGKGGVGKSMLASSLALLLSKNRKVVACDCDVDAPNLGLWLGTTDYDEREKISTSVKARIISQKDLDDKILGVCKFRAIEKVDGKYAINPFLCEGCGACKILYPNTIELKPVKNGELRLKKIEYGFPLVSGQLYPGEAGSGKIVEQLRKKAENFEYEVMILDAAAGIGCPVIASVRGCNYAVLITEPTPSGFSDLKRILEVVNHFNISYGIVINKWDINPDLSKKIEKWSGNKFLGKISYDKKVIDAIVNLKPVIKTNSKVVNEIEDIFKRLNSQNENLN
jgi:MinD superfamily P-loop ATPase